MDSEVSVHGHFILLHLGPYKVKKNILPVTMW
jgi:hypothetical protein